MTVVHASLLDKQSQTWKFCINMYKKQMLMVYLNNIKKNQGLPNMIA